MINHCGITPESSAFAPIPLAKAMRPVIGNPILPVIKLCANPRTVRTMAEHIDVDVSGLLRKELTPDQAAQLSPEQVQQIATHAEQHNPGIVDTVSGFYAQHPQLVKTLGSAALTVALAGIALNSSINSETVILPSFLLPQLRGSRPR